MLCVAVIFEYASSTASSGLVSPSPAAPALLDRLGVGQLLKRAHQLPGLLEPVEIRRVHVQHVDRLRLRTGERKVLRVVVAQHQAATSSVMLGEQRPALGRRERARCGPPRRAGS